jgi:hypothetical protein
MLRFRLRQPGHSRTFEHAGPLEFGRAGPRDGVARCVVADPWLSRHQLRVTGLLGGQAELTNLSQTKDIRLDDGVLPVGATRLLSLPVGLEVGSTRLEIASV